MNNNNKINVMSANNVNAILGKRTFMPAFIGKFLGQNSKAVAFLNIQSPIVGNKDPTNASGKKVTTNSSIAMSVIHLLVIPKEYKYNAVTLTGADVDLVKSMRRLGLKVGKELVKEIAGQPDFIRSNGAKNIVSKANKNTTNDSDFLTGFHVWPSHSTGHLHMHVVYKPWKSAGYDGQVAGKLITTETLLKVLEGNGNGNGNGVVDGSMSKADFETKQNRFRDLLVQNFNATLSNNNLKNASKGLILGNYKNNSKTVPFGAFKPSPLNNATRGQLNKIRQKIKNHANGKNVYLKTLPYAAYTNKLRKPNNNK